MPNTLFDNAEQKNYGITKRCEPLQLMFYFPGFDQVIQELFKTLKKLQNSKLPSRLELGAKELNHLVAILHVYAGSLIFMK